MPQTCLWRSQACIFYKRYKNECKIYLFMYFFIFCLSISLSIYPSIHLVCLSVCLSAIYLLIDWLFDSRRRICTFVWKGFKIHAIYKKVSSISFVGFVQLPPLKVTYTDQGDSSMIIYSMFRCLLEAVRLHAPGMIVRKVVKTHSINVSPFVIQFAFNVSLFSLTVLEQKNWVYEEKNWV